MAQQVKRKSAATVNSRDSQKYKKQRTADKSLPIVSGKQHNVQQASPPQGSDGSNDSDFDGFTSDEGEDGGVSLSEFDKPMKTDERSQSNAHSTHDTDGAGTWCEKHRQLYSC